MVLGFNAEAVSHGLSCSSTGTAERASPRQIRTRMPLWPDFLILSALRSRWKKVWGGGQRSLGEAKRNMNVFPQTLVSTAVFSRI